MKKIYQPREILEDLYWKAYEHTHSPGLISEALTEIDDYYKSKVPKKEEIIELIINMTRDGYGIHAIGESVYNLLAQKNMEAL